MGTVVLAEVGGGGVEELPHVVGQGLLVALFEQPAEGGEQAVAGEGHFQRDPGLVVGALQREGEPAALVDEALAEPRGDGAGRGVGLTGPRLRVAVEALGKGRRARAESWMKMLIR
jgi:hypothetical protein